MSKSRSGKTPSTNQNAPPATAQNAIIPGKFFESDWNELLEIEDDENFISDIIDEITDAACNQVFDNIIESRVHPHTVLSAREILLEIIELNFLQNDPGESDTSVKLSWIEDDEPCECIIDNWAQGAVPKNDYVDLEEIQELKENADVGTPLNVDSLDTSTTEGNFLNIIVGDENIDVENTVEEITPVTMETVANHADSVKDEPEASAEEDIEIKDVMSPQPQIKKKSKKYRPHVGSLPNFEKISLESVTDLRPKPGTRVSQKSMLSDFESSSELLVRNQYGRASGPKEVYYDEKGQVVKVQKLNVANFPKHRVPVKYSIIDTEKEINKKLHFSSKLNKNKNQTAEKSILSRNRISADALLRRIQPAASWGPSSIPEYNGNVNGCMQYSFEPRSPLPPLMVDTMNVTDGVTIREGGLSKQVMKKATHETSVDTRAIHPINNSSNRVLEVKDIVSDSSPTFRYINASQTLAGL